ncbi:hypothetical protein QKW60_04040 [Defluviimonas aestuarii]|uniref:hypothetical protein n=1 Tax=Albidovulum aestuarii TaxID=1130726 RepID=UPI00249AB9AF|nr:hypothetical protein [Defluviimonas aestuarii]MDI3335567.1 hypothetical protein [Defluviimonas aestuarii]
MDNNCSDRGDVYVIAVHDFVVLKDLEDTVREFDPTATVLTTTSCDEAITKIRTQDQLAMVFIEAGPVYISAVRMDELVRARGGRIVLLGDDAEDEWDEGRSPRRWPTLQRPFSSQSVLSIIIAGRR